MCIMILIAYIIVAEIIEIKKIDFIHESGVAIFLGVFAGAIVKFGLGQTIEFDESSLFYFILPPIIFSAGYTLKRNKFMENFSFIVMFGLIGTLISMVVMSYLVITINRYLFSSEEYRNFRLSDFECLLL